MSRLALWSLIAALASSVSCGGDEPSVVVVNVAARASVQPASRFEVMATNGTESISTSLDVTGLALPLTFSITPTGRSGTIEVAVRAVDADGILLGLGDAKGTIERNGRADLSLQLTPADFVVNSSIGGEQRLTFTNLTGKQIAADSDGNFLITFVNDCATLGRCDLFARRFDANGTPLQNGVSMDTAEFIANLSDATVSAPTVAIGSSGSILLAWDTLNDVRGVALDSTASHLGTSETIWSISEEFPEQIVTTALAAGGGAGNNYVVVWNESFGAAIRGRLLTPGGQPRVNPITGSDADFGISTVDGPVTGQPTVTATGEGLAFAAAWTADASVRARFFDAAGTPRTSSEVSLASYSSGAVVFGIHMAWTEESAMVGWGVADSSDPDLSRGRYIVRRFSSPSGIPMGPERVVAQSTPAGAAGPALAALSGGQVGVTWHGCGAEGDGAGCGVFFQLLRPSGLAVGEAILVNTTTQGDQADPSIAAIAADSFAVTWNDSSQAAPDDSEGSVRARLIYIETDPTDGRLGARCGNPSTDVCADGLVCVAGSENRPFCHRACDPQAASQCPNGGICSTVAGVAGCLF